MGHSATQVKKSVHSPLFNVLGGMGAGQATTVSSFQFFYRPNLLTMLDLYRRRLKATLVVHSWQTSTAILSVVRVAVATRDLAMKE